MGVNIAFNLTLMGDAIIDGAHPWGFSRPEWTGNFACKMQAANG